MSMPADALTANRFTITIDGYEIATFSVLSGIVAEVEASEYWETSGDEIAVSKLPGKFKPPTITLKRGLTGSPELWAGTSPCGKGPWELRAGVAPSMFNSEGKPVARYWLENAWPSKIEVASLKAGASEALMETVTLTCEYIQRVSP